MEAISKGKNMG